ncbi:NBS-containing resistance-like protein, partial [Trifolium medium]|nr:NBS-containing resistance-like protein [Trifolium medium]
LKSKGNETTQTEFDAGSHLLLIETNIVANTNDPISKENAPMDLSKSEDGSDEDPFAELESILLGSPKFLPKVACTQAINHNNNYMHLWKAQNKQPTHENVSPKVVALVQKMTSSIENLFKDFVMTKNVVEDHINTLQQKEKLMQRVRDAKKQKESMKKEKSQFKDEAKRFEG